MMNNGKIKKILGILFLIPLMFITRVYAATDSFKTTISTSDLEVERETNVIVTIGLTDINIESGDKGIGAYIGKIKFDSTVLEYVSSKGTDKWESLTYQNGRITSVTSDGEVIREEQTIGTITFRVKKGAKLGETTITLESFEGSTGISDIMASNSETKIKIVVNHSSNEGNDNNNHNNATDNNQSNNSDITDEDNQSDKDDPINNNNNDNDNNHNSNDDSNSTQKPSDNNIMDNTKPKETLPKIMGMNIILVVGIGLAIVCVIVFYLKKNK